jgi:hypothetical protein
MACDGATAAGPKAIKLTIAKDITLLSQERYAGNPIEVPLDAKVDDVIAAHSFLEGCCGFFAVKRQAKDDYYDYFDEEETTEPTGLAEKLAVDGGVLLAPGHSFSFYGIDATSCSEVVLFGVFADVLKKPLVFKKDVEEAGFGDNIYNYVKLHAEDKELSIIRRYFASPVFAKGKENDVDIRQTVEFSMEDKFTIAKQMMVLTVNIHQNGVDVIADCTNVAGIPKCSIQLAPNDTVEKLKLSLCEKLQWRSVACWNGSDQVVDSDVISQYSLLTAEQINAEGLVSGCYQNTTSDCRPAGYSASGTSSSNYLVLEPGKAGLQSLFKGDYKRAQELRKLVMNDAQWSIESLEEGLEVVRIAGKATLSRYLVHERSGSDGDDVREYTCNCLVTIPVDHLLSAQTEYHSYHSTEGSGWTCGSEDYKCSFYLPMPLLSALRTKPENGSDDKILDLRIALNDDSSPEYPYKKNSERRMYGRCSRNIKKETVDMIRHFREGFASNPNASIDEL